MHETCPQCKATLPNRARFCGRCGFSLVDGIPNQTTEEATAFENPSRWPELRGIIFFYGLLLAASLVFGLYARVQGELSPKVEAIYWTVIVLLDIHFVIVFWPRVKSSFGFRLPRLRSLLEFTLACALCYVFIRIYFHGLVSWGWPMMDDDSYRYFIEGWPWWSVYVMSALLPGVFEEIAFRGVIQSKLEDLTGLVEAMVIQAALFSVLHLSIIIFISHFVMGLLLGWLRHRSGNLYLGIILHIWWNSYVIYNQNALGSFL